MIFEFGVFLTLIVLGFVVGRLKERNHYEKLKHREIALSELNTSTFGKKNISGKDSQLFVGSMVVSIDYFKATLASFRSIFGGRLKSYETLLDRAKREATVRMKEKALLWGADEIRNIRVETSNIANSQGQNSGLVAVEIMVYGTGVKI